MQWPQRYDPLHNALLSTLAAALPLLVLLGLLAARRIRAHHAALLALATALAIAVGVIRMPTAMAAKAALTGAAYGFFPIGWARSATCCSWSIESVPTTTCW